MATAAEEYRHLERALDQHRVLAESISSIREGLDSTPVTAQALNDAIQAAQSATAQLEGYLQSRLNNIPITLRPSPASSQVFNRVLSIPELVEHILLSLEAKDLLSARRVNQSMRSAVDASQVIQRKMFFRPDPTAFHSPLDKDLMRPFSATRSFAARQSGDRVLHEHRLHISLDRKQSSRHRERPALAAEMLVCQPPILDMDVELGCRCMSDSRTGARPSGWAELSTLSSATGITVGQLVERTHELRSWHLHCPDAPLSSRSPDGRVMTTVNFCGNLVLSEEDPLKSKGLRERNARNARHAELQERFGSYIEATRTARDAGRRIPTFAEFQAEERDAGGTAVDGST